MGCNNTNANFFTIAHTLIHTIADTDSSYSNFKRGLSLFIPEAGWHGLGVGVEWVWSIG